MYVLVTGETATYYTPTDLRRDNPDTSFPAVITDSLLAEFSVWPCLRVDAPAITQAQNLALGPPEYADGQWRQTWSVTDVDASEAAARLLAAKIERKSAVNAIRNVREAGPAPTIKGPVQSDLASQSKINGAVLMAVLAMQAGQPFAVTWTMADNSNVTHTAAEIVAMGQAVGGYVAACHAHGVAIKAQIDAAADFAALDAIDLDAGWPA